MSDVTNGELMRVVTRIEGKVDRQGEAITGLHARMAVLEDRDSREAEPQKRGKPMLAGTGLGAALVMVLEYLRHTFGGKP